MLMILLLGALAATPVPVAKAQAMPRLAWLTDLASARAQARAQHKLVLLFFHGSDWCQDGTQMEKEVFGSREFAEYAAANLVLVDVDFPERAQQSDALRRANLALKQRFNLGDEWREGLPTVVVLDAKGYTLSQEKGYHGDGAGALIARIERLRGM
jgi:thioredoxin-related protein